MGLKGYGKAAVGNEQIKPEQQWYFLKSMETDDMQNVVQDAG